MSSRKIGSSGGLVEEWERHPLQRIVVTAVITEKEGPFHVISLVTSEQSWTNENSFVSQLSAKPLRCHNATMRHICGIHARDTSSSHATTVFTREKLKETSQSHFPMLILSIAKQAMPPLDRRF
jgi:hypothetical protein